MSRWIRRGLRGIFASRSHRKLRCRPPRRLAFEDLEGRTLLSVAGIADGSFEVPAMALNAYQYAPNGSPWQFVGGAGVCSNGSAFGNPIAPDGVQSAFLQSGSISESAYFDAGTYTLSFQAAQRVVAAVANTQAVQVLVDGTQVGVVTPTGITYASYQTSNFTVTTGTHTVALVGLNPQGGDNTAFVDEMTTAAVGISEGSFEAPALAAASFQYAPSGSPWQFAAGGGVCGNGSVFGNPAASDGVQAGFVQGNGTMSQSMHLDAGTYQISLLAAQRGALPRPIIRPSRSCSTAHKSARSPRPAPPMDRTRPPTSPCRRRGAHRSRSSA